MTVDPQYPTDHEQELEISAIEKHNWKTGAARDFWKEPLETCRRHYSFVEVLAVASDETDRQVTPIERSRLRDEEYIRAITGNDLEVKTVHDIAFIGEDTDAAQHAAAAHRDDNTRALGELYGYPDCCIDHFIENVEAENEQPIYEIACNSDCATAQDEENQEILLEDPEPMLNIFWQYMGWQFISHTPCSFDCEESIEIATAHGGLYRDLDLDKEAELLWQFLGTPTTWTGYHGLSNILNGYLIGSTNTPEYWDYKKVVFNGEHAAKLAPPVEEQEPEPIDGIV